VAPRVVPAAGRRSTLARYLADRSPLDLGPDPALVRPGGAVSYLPTACVLVRASAFRAFDESLRYGEDVDLIWRLVDAGAALRYDPVLTVRHCEPRTW